MQLSPGRGEGCSPFFVPAAEKSRKKVAAGPLTFPGSSGNLRLASRTDVRWRSERGMGKCPLPPKNKTATWRLRMLGQPLPDCGLLGAQLLRPTLQTGRRPVCFTLRGFEHTAAARRRSSIVLFHHEKRTPFRMSFSCLWWPKKISTSWLPMDCGFHTQIGFFIKNWHFRTTEELDNAFGAFRVTLSYRPFEGRYRYGAWPSLLELLPTPLCQL